MAIGRLTACTVLLCLAATAHAAPPPPVIDLPALAASAARRYPQPVRVGDLLGRDVVQPVESQPVLGHVAAVIRRPDGGLDVIIHYGGAFGIGSRPIAVPVEAMALLSPILTVVGVTTDQLDRLATVPFPHADTLGPNEQIRVGIVRPFH